MEGTSTVNLDEVSSKKSLWIFPSVSLHTIHFWGIILLCQKYHTRVKCLAVSNEPYNSPVLMTTVKKVL
jgi:hypothetical protein